MTVALRARLAGAPSRVLVVAAGVVAAGWVAVGPRLHATGYWPDRLVDFAPVVFTFGALIVIITGLFATAVGRYRPRRFDVVEGGFVAGPAAAYGLLVAGEVLLLGSFAHQWLSPPLGVNAAFGVVVIAVGVVVAALVGTVLAGRPRLTLTPDGIELRDRIGGRHLPWATLRADQPPRASGIDMLVLSLAHPELVTGRAIRRRTKPVERIAPGMLGVQPAYLAAAIGFYLTHPDLRSGIGTPAGYAALQSGLRPVAA